MMMMTNSKMKMMMMMTNQEETLKSPARDSDFSFVPHSRHAEQFAFYKKKLFCKNELSRAESTIFIATTINNQHFLQMSAPLCTGTCKSEKNVDQSINQSITYLTNEWHQLLMIQIL